MGQDGKRAFSVKLALYFAIPSPTVRHLLANLVVFV